MAKGQKCSGLMHDDDGRTMGIGVGGWAKRGVVDLARWGHIRMMCGHGHRLTVTGHAYLSYNILVFLV